MSMSVSNRAPLWKELLLWAVVVVGPVGIACESFTPMSVPPPPADASPDGTSETLTGAAPSDPVGGMLDDTLVFCVIERKACENFGPLTASIDGHAVAVVPATEIEAATMIAHATSNGDFAPSEHRIQCFATRDPVSTAMGDSIRVEATRNTDGSVDTQIGVVATTRTDLVDSVVDDAVTSPPGAAPATCASSAAGTYEPQGTSLESGATLSVISSSLPREVANLGATTCPSGDRGTTWALVQTTGTAVLESTTRSTCPGSPTSTETLIDSNVMTTGCGTVIGVNAFGSAGEGVVISAVCDTDSLIHLLGYNGTSWTHLFVQNEIIDGYEVYGSPTTISGDENGARRVYAASVLAEEIATTDVEQIILLLEEVGGVWNKRVAVAESPGFPKEAADRPQVNAAGREDEVPGELHTPFDGNFSIQFVSRLALLGAIDGLWQFDVLAGTSELILDLSTPITGLATGISAIVSAHSFAEGRGLIRVTTTGGNSAIVQFGQAADGSGLEFEKVVEVGEAVPGGGGKTFASLGSVASTAGGAVYTGQTTSGQGVLVGINRAGSQELLVGADRPLDGGVVNAVGLAARSMVGGGPGVPGGGLVADVTVDFLQSNRFFQSERRERRPTRLMFVQPWSPTTNRLNVVDTDSTTTTNLSEPPVKSLSGLDRDPATGNLLVTTGFGANGACYDADRSTGALSLLGNPAALLAIPGVAFDSGGQAWATVVINNGGQQHWLARLDKTDCTPTLVAQQMYQGSPSQFGDGLTFCRGKLLATTGSAFPGGAGIGELDTTTAVLSNHVTFPGVTTTIAGLTCSCDNEVLGSLGAGIGDLYSFDFESHTAEKVMNLAPDSIPDLLALDCEADGLDDRDEVSTIVNDPDSDNDGVLDGDESALGIDPADPDSDGDGLIDGYELLHGLDPGVADNTTSDVDGDLLTLAQEHALRTDPALADSDADGLSDGAEFSAGTNPLLSDSDGDSVPDALDPNALDPDSDHDGMSDGAEAGLFRTTGAPVSLDPMNPDSDGDGLYDGVDPEPAIPATPSIPIPSLPSGGLVLIVLVALAFARIVRR